MSHIQCRPQHCIIKQAERHVTLRTLTFQVFTINNDENTNIYVLN